MILRLSSLSYSQGLDDPGSRVVHHTHSLSSGLWSGLTPPTQARGLYTTHTHTHSCTCAHTRICSNAHDPAMRVIHHRLSLSLFLLFLSHSLPLSLSLSSIHKMCRRGTRALGAPGRLEPLSVALSLSVTHTHNTVQVWVRRKGHKGGWSLFRLPSLTHTHIHNTTHSAGLGVTIGAPGWLEGESDSAWSAWDAPLRQAAADDGGDLFACNWEPAELRRLGSLLSTYLRNQAVRPSSSLSLLSLLSTVSPPSLPPLHPLGPPDNIVHSFVFTALPPSLHSVLGSLSLTRSLTHSLPPPPLPLSLHSVLGSLLILFTPLDVRRLGRDPPSPLGCDPPSPRLQQGQTSSPPLQA